MFDIGWQELLLILAIVLLLFGAKRLPEIARSMGQGVREFRRAAKSFMEEDETEGSSDSRALPPVSSDHSSFAQASTLRSRATAEDGSEDKSEPAIPPRPAPIETAGTDVGERN